MIHLFSRYFWLGGLVLHLFMVGAVQSSQHNSGVMLGNVAERASQIIGYEIVLVSEESRSWLLQDVEQITLEQLKSTFNHAVIREPNGAFRLLLLDLKRSIGRDKRWVSNRVPQCGRLRSLHSTKCVPVYEKDPFRDAHLVPDNAIDVNDPEEYVLSHTGAAIPERVLTMEQEDPVASVREDATETFTGDGIEEYALANPAIVDTAAATFFEISYSADGIEERVLPIGPQPVVNGQPDGRFAVSYTGDEIEERVLLVEP